MLRDMAQKLIIFAPKINNYYAKDISLNYIRCCCQYFECFSSNISKGDERC